MPQPSPTSARARLPAGPVRATAALVVSAAAVLFLAAPAEARVGHRAAETRAAAGAYASSARMAVDSQDRVTVLWWHFDGSNQRIQAVRLGADGTPGAVQTLAADAAGVEVAIDSQDRVTVVWRRSAFDGDRLQAVRLGADGTPGAVQTLDAAGQTAISPQVAIDSEGRATVVWTSIPQDPNASGAIQAVRLGADGTPGPVHTLSTVRFPDHPQVAVDSQDRATVVWAGRPLQSVRLGADGTPGPVQTLSAEHAFDPQVAIDSQDRATVVWEGTNDAADANGIRSVRLGADGAPEAVQTLTPEVASSPQVAIDSQDRATVVWNTVTAPRSKVQSVRLGADGTPEAVQTLSAAGETAVEPQVAIDSQDRATVVWDTLPRPSSKVQSVRLGADGTPGAVQTLFFDASFPQVAIDSQDRATVVWTRAYPGPPGTIGVGTIQSVRLNADGTPGAVHTLSQPDDSAPQLVLRGETQRLGEAVVVQASCDEYCTVLAAGRLKIRDGSSSAAAAGAGKLELKPAMGETSFGWGGVLNPAWLSLKVRKEGRKAAARALKRGKKVVAEIEGAAIDAAGNVDIANRTVKLKR